MSKFGFSEHFFGTCAFGETSSLPRRKESYYKSKPNYKYDLLDQVEAGLLFIGNGHPFLANISEDATAYYDRSGKSFYIKVNKEWKAIL